MDVFYSLQFFDYLLIFVYLEHLIGRGDPGSDPRGTLQGFYKAYVTYAKRFIYVQNLVKIGSVVFESIKNKQTNRDTNIQRPVNLYI